MSVTTSENSSDECDDERSLYESATSETPLTTSEPSGECDNERDLLWRVWKCDDE